ncbi:MAG: outer membrane beta-barrel protein, partial [Bacteroidota bacterium]
ASIGNGHGLFTYYLVDGLSGLADVEGAPDNKITFREIRSYVDKNVPSLALQRFKRKQDPYFCCNEFNENVVSRVDSTYLKKWLQTKKQQNRGGGNSVALTEGYNNANRKNSGISADTALIETYNRFYKAIKSNTITGRSSAEEYFQQLTKKYPGNPYTLDAKSTLSVEYINAAQRKVDQYLGCSDNTGTKEKQAAYDAAINLEKAIASIREDDADFANSLLGRMYLLKASGNNATTAVSLQYAYGALAIDPNGAYIQNKLALLHLENNNADSAFYYASKASKTAPKWVCALTTLALVQKAMGNTKNPDPTNKQPKKSPGKSRFGITAGGGLTRSNPTYSGNVNTGFVGVNANSATTLDLGLVCQVTISNTIAIRPATTITFDAMDIDFQRRPATGGAPITETMSVKSNSVSLALPVIIKLSTKKTIPYISLGPSFNYLLGQNSATADILPLKKFGFSGDAGIGIDLGNAKSPIIITPELKYSAGLSDNKDNTATSPNATALSSLKKNAFTLSIYLRKR